MEKAVVLLSGGVDSTTCLAMAVEKYGARNVTALCLIYGQKHSKELLSAHMVAAHYGVQFFVKDLTEVFSFSKCSLLQGREDIKHSSYSEQLAEMGGEGTVATYVPFRNGLFLSTAASIALSLGASVIYYGAHADDAAGRAYPDCTPEFEGSISDAIFEGSGRLLRLEAPLLHLNKAGIVAIGSMLKAPYALTWSCYEGKDKQCGTCGTCIDRKAAFRANETIDPVEYEI